ncbi:MAG: hypothetical protein AAF773_21705 [Cyanobacteria bacterium P01_D01_bin.115]
MDNSLRAFLYPQARYQGVVRPEQLVFNANLQTFAQRVGYISGLHTGGRLSSDDAVEQISQLWEQLKASRQQLGMGLSEDKG